MNIDYDHEHNLHTLRGPQMALPVMLSGQRVTSILDVGCGAGTWLKAAIEFGIQDVFGVDGVSIPIEQLHVRPDKVLRQDLTQSWDLGRGFDATLCLEVAEHLDPAHAPILIDALVNHSDLIFFSAASPDQDGQHHVNCQWPSYWQNLFNIRGYACCDLVRWGIWEITTIEPWYRQNMFVARRAPLEAGKEPRIPSVIHPEMMPWLRSKIESDLFREHVEQIKYGRMPLGWYWVTPFRAIWTKLARKLS